jgi:hypothetical protein
MKTVEILPRDKSAVYSTLVKREAEIRQNGRGTFVRSGLKRAGSAIWKHKKFKGSVNLKRGLGEVVTAKIRSSQPQDEFGLLKAFLGFIDRYCLDQVFSITIRYG